MRGFFLSVPLGVLGVFAGCGETVDIPGVAAPDGGGGTPPVSRSPADGGADGASQPADAGTDAELPDADIGGLTCDDLVRAYGLELAKARACNPRSPVDECTALRERILGCGCNTALSANRVGALDRIAAQWQKKECFAKLCPAVACVDIERGSCDGAQEPAVCRDVVGG